MIYRAKSCRILLFKQTGFFLLNLYPNIVYTPVSSFAWLSLLIDKNSSRFRKMFLSSSVCLFRLRYGNCDDDRCANHPLFTFLKKENKKEHLPFPRDALV